MKKLIWIIPILFICTSSFAQAKIGYISLQELMVTMPEFKKAESDLVDYQKALIEQGNELQREFEKRDSIDKIESLKWTAAQREIKRKELEQMYRRVMGYNDEAQQLYSQKEQSLLLPIQQKAIKIVQEVGKENGYSYVLNKEHLISYPTADDLLPLVLKKLNLKVGMPK